MKVTNSPLISCAIAVNENEMYDQSIGSTKTKYIKLNTKTQILFCYLNENLMTFLYTLIGATRKQKEKKKFSF